MDGAARMAKMRKALQETPLWLVASHADKIAAGWDEACKGVMYRGKPHPTFDEYLFGELGLAPSSAEEDLASAARARMGPVCNGTRTKMHRIKRRVRR